MDEPSALEPRDEGSSDEESASVEDREQRLAAIRAAVERGLEDVKAGRVTDLDAAFDRIETMLDEIEAAKRA